MSTGADFAIAIAIFISAGCVVGTAAVRAQDISEAGPATVAASSEGRDVYEAICQACHMADAKGGAGAGAEIPALASNANLADKDFLVNIVLNGRGGMPWLRDLLSHQQIASVATYVRSEFNDYNDPVTEADVKRVAGDGTASPLPPACTTC